jgi:pimeloyl-ACP methyl ester carboxylesterase
MKSLMNTLSQNTKIDRNVAELLKKRLKHAEEGFSEALREAQAKSAATLPSLLSSPTVWNDYAVDFAQRAILFWDTMRQRGNDFREHQKKGLPPLLHFEYETVLDARKFARPVNYALLRIVPPKGVTVDMKRRPYIVIDPRAGHGPGIGGFKDDSQVGVALRDGHPVYFVSFFPEPEPGQTLLDVCEAETVFVHKVRELHPDSPKPVIIGNCQGGWAAMMLAASDPDDTGPIVINGAPMSYWGGAWEEGAGDNPMRYSGGLLGGTWLSSMVADLSNGVFDGAWLVQNFESLHPANTFFDKYYHVFKNVDTEPPRFLEFERWWGGMFLLNREEIEWITQNLFVGNKLWSDVKSKQGKLFDLKAIRSPIVLFASMGDDITPPEQAFNWVADTYGSTDEIKANGQVIVGLLHRNVGHLGIFVSGAVARKEHAQIVSVLKSIEALPPGLYGMNIIEHQSKDGVVSYDVEFVEHTLEEVSKRLNRFERKDEKAFEAVAKVSEFNQKAYELFAQPLVQQMSNETTARLGRTLHPLRMQRWAISDINPWLGWLAPAAAFVKSQRKAAGPENPLRQLEMAGSGILSATLTYYRAVQDAISEAAFFQLYGHMFANLMADRSPSLAREQAADARQAETVRAALAQIADGGYPAAVARIAFLLKDKGDKPLPLSRLHLKAEMIKDYADLLPETTPDEQRRIRGTQEIIVGESLEAALATLPKLLTEPADAARLETLLEKLMQDERILSAKPTAAQKGMLARIRKALGYRSLPPPVAKKPPVRRAATTTKKPAAVPAAPAASSAAKPKAVAKPKAAARAKAPAAKQTKS